MRKVLCCTAVAVAGIAAAAAFGAAAAKVSFTLKEFSVLGPSRTKAGKVTFVVKNGGKLPHELLVVKTRMAAAKLPVKGALVNVKKLDLEGKISAIKPRATKRLTVALKKGKYVLFCNLPGHYKAGQFKAFKVG